MAIFDEGINPAVFIIAIMFAGLPFVARYLKERAQEFAPSIVRHVHHQPLKTHYRTLMLPLVVTLSLASIPFVSAQELYGIPTEDGMEFYQVPATLDFSGSSIGNSGLAGTSGMESYHHLFAGKTISPFTPGFHTTTSGRLLTVAGRIDWTASNNSSLVTPVPETTPAFQDFRGVGSPLGEVFQQQVKGTGFMVKK